MSRGDVTRWSYTSGQDKHLVDLGVMPVRICSSKSTGAGFLPSEMFRRWESKSQNAVHRYDTAKS